ncbi:MAG: hypothetical protein PVF58_14080 [Candidatus Methanofastidiosia archaeon]|jgi:hypothetical protein
MNVKTARAFVNRLGTSKDVPAEKLIIKSGESKTCENLYVVLVKIEDLYITYLYPEKLHRNSFPAIFFNIKDAADSYAARCEVNNCIQCWSYQGENCQFKGSNFGKGVFPGFTLTY